MRTQFLDGKKPQLSVRTQLVTTVLSRDAKVAAFLRALRLVTPTMDDSDLVQACTRAPCWPRAPSWC
jgi:hypothetical protein